MNYSKTEIYQILQKAFGGIFILDDNLKEEATNFYTWLMPFFNNGTLTLKDIEKAMQENMDSVFIEQLKIQIENGSNNSVFQFFDKNLRDFSKTFRNKSGKLNLDDIVHWIEAHPNHRLLNDCFKLLMMENIDDSDRVIINIDSDLLFTLGLITTRPYTKCVYIQEGNDKGVFTVIAGEFKEHRQDGFKIMIASQSNIKIIHGPGAQYNKLIFTSFNRVSQIKRIFTEGNQVMLYFKGFDFPNNIHLKSPEDVIDFRNWIANSL